MLEESSCLIIFMVFTLCVTLEKSDARQAFCGRHRLKTEYVRGPTRPHAYNVYLTRV